MFKENNSRRAFLRKASCAAVGYSTLVSTLNSLKAANAAAIANSSTYLNGDYKALVCVLFSGGMDSYNMLIPRGTSEYQEYADSRSNLAIPQNELLQINPLNPNGKQYGLHPSMQEVQGLFESGDLAMIANVGTLVEPTTRDDYEQGSSQLPKGLFSHIDQQMHWQTGIPQTRGAIGWGGRMADLIGDMNANQTVSMNISLGGSNIFQSGVDSVEYAIDNESGSYPINGYSTDNLFNQLRSQGIDSLLDYHYQDLFKKTYIDKVKSSKESHEQFSAALSGLSPFNTQFSATEFSKSLEMVAKTIAVRQTLGMSRQIFFVNFGGWDHHDDILLQQSEMLGELDAGLAEFHQVLNEINMLDCVTTYTISDFGRTLTSNGDGTDHAWGGNALVMGGAVKGRDIYGTYPSLALGSEFEIGRGALLPTTSTDVYFAELAKWYGVSNTDLPIILPNVGNFYNLNGNTPPLGFLNI